MNTDEPVGLRDPAQRLQFDGLALPTGSQRYGSTDEECEEYEKPFNRLARFALQRHAGPDNEGATRWKCPVHAGRHLIGTRVLVLVNGLEIRVISEEGELIRELTLDTSRDYQPHGRS